MAAAQCTRPRRPCCPTPTPVSEKGAASSRIQLMRLGPALIGLALAACDEDSTRGDRARDTATDASTPLRDGGRRSEPADSGDSDAGPVPPPYCVAPCLWEIVRPCIPVLRHCIVDQSPSAFGTTTCDPDTGFAVFQDYGSAVFRDGHRCLAVSGGGLSPAPPEVMNASGGVAVLDGNVVVCGVAAADYLK